MLAICKFLRDKYSLAAVSFICLFLAATYGSKSKFVLVIVAKTLLFQVTNDIFTKEDGEFLVKNGALPEERIRAVETGGCPHAAIREDISINLGPLEELSKLFKTDILLCESGGGNFLVNN